MVGGSLEMVQTKMRKQSKESQPCKISSWLVKACPVDSQGLFKPVMS